MTSEEWCKVARVLLAVVAILAMIFVFIYAVIMAVVVGESGESGQAALQFFTVFFSGYGGIIVGWFVACWLIRMLDELRMTRASQEKLLEQQEKINQVLLSKFYKEKDEEETEGYLRFAGKQALAANELLTRLVGQKEEEPEK